MVNAHKLQGPPPSFGQLQVVLARLYTDVTFRVSFLANPEGVGASVGLGAGESRQLAALAAGEIDAFAHSLLRKRLREVTKLLPLTYAARGRDFETAFLQYAQTRVPQGGHRHRDDAIAFAAWLHNAYNKGGSNLDWPAPLLDLARYEAAWLTVAALPRGLAMRRLNHHPLRVTHDIAAGVRIQELQRQPVVALWIRPGPAHQLWHRIIGLPQIKP